MENNIYKKPKGLSRKNDRNLWKQYVNLPTIKKANILTDLRHGNILIDVLRKKDGDETKSLSDLSDSI